MTKSKVNPSEIKEAVDNSGRYELSFLTAYLYSKEHYFYALFICRILPLRW